MQVRPGRGAQFARADGHGGSLKHGHGSSLSRLRLKRPVTVDAAAAAPAGQELGASYRDGLQPEGPNPGPSLSGAPTRTPADSPSDPGDAGGLAVAGIPGPGPAAALPRLAVSAAGQSLASRRAGSRSRCH